MAILDRDDLMDILSGATILGAGGGGDLSEGVGLIDDAIAQGKTFEMVDLHDVPDDGLVATPYHLGAISDIPAEEEEGYKQLEVGDQQPILTAYHAFQARMDQDFYGTVPCELGGSNTAVAFYVAAMMGQKTIDADPAGRAVPEITHSTYYLNNLGVGPIVMANAFGEVITLENVQDDLRAETVVRALSVVSRHDIAAVDHVLPAEDLRDALIPGTLSQCQSLGAAQRRAIAARENVADAIAEAGGGMVAFEGMIGQCEWRTEGGFTLGSVTIMGSGASIGHIYKIGLKNENLVAWKDDAVHATIPDVICLIDTLTGEVVQNPHFEQGQTVAVVILPAPKAFLTERGLSIFGPAYAGLSGKFWSPLK
ncbi:MAG: DUF917 domain-containing protein [Pseudomonadota bacterium]